MKTATNNLQPATAHEPQLALTQRMNKLGFFVGLPTGFMDYDINGSLNLLSDGTFISMIPGVKAAYFVPYPEHDDGLYSAVIGLLYDLVNSGAGVYSCSKVGFKWMVFNTEAYAKIGKQSAFNPDEFRVYPQEDS